MKRFYWAKTLVASVLISGVASGYAFNSTPLKVNNPFGQNGVEYLLVGYSMFDFTQADEDQNVYGAGGKLCSYPVFLSLDAENSKFQIYNLVNLSSDIAQLPVEGDYNAKAGTLTINTNPWFESVDETGVIAAQGDDYIILQAGSPVGAGYWQDAEQLVINCESDGNVLTPASGFGAFGYQYDDYWEEFNQTNLYDVMFNTHLYKVADGVNILPSSYKLDLGECFIGESRSICFSIINAGTEESDFVMKTIGDGFSANVKSGSLEALGSKEITVAFTPEEISNYEGKIIIQSEGEDIVISLSAVGSAYPDYSKIVTEGADKMVFTTSMDYPWYISEDIIDAPVAVSSNVGIDNSKSSLIVSVSIPEGEKGVLNWSGFYDPHYGTRDEFIVSENDNEVFCTPLKHQICDVEGHVNLLAGEHEIRFTYSKDMAIFPQGVVFGNDRAWLRELSLKVNPYKAQDGSLENEDVDFGRFYLVMDAVEHSVQETILTNEGFEPLSITEVKSAGIFYGSVDATQINPEKSVNVTIGFKATAPGEYDDDVIVVTSAGEFPVHCHVNIEPSPDYSAIVNEGEFIFVPDNSYPFIVEDGKAYNSTAGVPDNEETLSVLTAVFNVPTGKYGKLTWDGETDTQANAWNADYGVAMIDNNAYHLHFYHGHDYAGHYSADPYEVYLTPGTHMISWGYFQCGDGVTYGTDRLSISNLNLELMDEIPTFEVWQPTPIDLGEVFDGSFNIKTIQVANLTNKNMAFVEGNSKDDFTIELDEEMNSEIPSMSNGTIDIIFSPLKPGEFSYELTLTTDAGDLVIPVVAVGRDSSKMAFVEDFENGFDGWQVIDDNNDKYYWEPDVAGTYSRTGLGSAMIGTVFSDFTDDYLVSPEFTVPEKDPYLEYWRRYTKEDNNDYDILIGEGSDPMAYEAIFTDEGHSQFEFEKVSVDLSAFAGRTVRVAFHNHTADGQQSVLIIDDLAVGGEDTVRVNEISDNVVSREYYDLQGVRLSELPTGIVVEKLTLSDGTMVYKKVIAK